MSAFTKLASLFPRPRPYLSAAHDKVDAIAARYAVDVSNEVAAVHDRIDALVDRGEYEQINAILEALNPTYRVQCFTDSGPIIMSEPSSYQVSVIPPAKVFQHHLKYLKEDLTSVVVNRNEVRFYIGDSKVAVYFAHHSIPHDLLAEKAVIEAQRLIADLTETTFAKSQLRKMNRAVLIRHANGWLVEFLDP